MDTLIRAAGLRPAQLVDGRARIPLRALHTLWSSVAQHLDEPSLGISALLLLNAGGPSSWPEPFSLFERLLGASETLRAGLDCMERYVRLLRDEMACHREEGRETTILRFELSEQEPMSLVQLHVGMAVLLARRVLPDHKLIEEVWFRQPAPQDPALFETFFGLPVKFGARFDGFVSRSEVLDLTLPQSNPLALSHFVFRADAWLRELPDSGSMVVRVREAVVRALSAGEVVGAPAIAKHLALSQRTLHRRLQAEGESFQSIYDSVRCELAKRELASGCVPVHEVGRRVGFTNTSAFYRAFKTWTGHTPAEFQQRSMRVEERLA